MSLFKTVNIVYDGQCAFCIRSLNVVSELDIYGALQFYDSHDPATIEMFPELRGADVDNAMYAVAKSERLYRGFFAFRRLIWSGPLMWVLIPLFYFPGASFFGTRVYTWIAKNRSRFGCHSDACSLPARPRSKRVQDEGQSVHL